MGVKFKATLIFPRWRFVIHAGIDGYSRSTVYIHCSNNNRAQTVGNLFFAAVNDYCWPSRVRADKGVENGEVARLMLAKHGEGRGSIILGSSVHNQRIERLWRDVRKTVTEYYRKVFYFMEEHNLLDPTNEVDLFCLHYVYLPRINFALCKFKDAWNNHKLSTEGGKTPNQLYILGMLQLFGSNYRSVKEFFDQGNVNDNDFGVEIPNTPEPSVREDGNVVVPEINLTVPDSCFAELRERINNRQRMETNNYIDTFISCKQIVTNHVINNT